VGACQALGVDYGGGVDRKTQVNGGAENLGVTGGGLWGDWQNSSEPKGDRLPGKTGGGEARKWVWGFPGSTSWQTQKIAQLETGGRTSL